MVSLPRRLHNCQLGDSLSGTIRRFQSLELKFKQNPALHKDYSAFMHGYLNLGHMSLLDAYDLAVEQSDTFYLPHHSVFKVSSITTKLRVVVDCSAKTTSNLSLNDTLMVGPTVQQDLFSIMARFRTHRYVTDIVAITRLFVVVQ